MMFSRGCQLQVKGLTYTVTGSVSYRDSSDNSIWEEYTLEGPAGTLWLVYDPTIQGFELSRSTDISEVPAGYALKDRGIQVCVSSDGPVDTDPGEQARYEDYADSYGRTYSIERWDGETEYSVGEILSARDVVKAGGTGFGFDSSGSSGAGNNNSYRGTGPEISKNRSGKKIPVGVIAAIVIAILAVVVMCVGAPKSFGQNDGGNTDMAGYISQNYEYVTSVTGNNDLKADVYSSETSVDATAKDIIGSQGSDLVDAQTSDDGTSVAMISENECCLVYLSDSTSTEENAVPVDQDAVSIEDGKTLIQISSRKYAYENDSRPYRSSHSHYLFWRRFYKNRGYDGDRNRYHDSPSPYSDPSSSGNGDDSNSIRDQSVGGRSSSDGGPSSGK